MITCGVMICRRMIWILHLNYWILSVLQGNFIFRARNKDCWQRKSLLKTPIGWIEWRDFEVNHWGNAVQVNNFRPSKNLRQGIVGCSEKTNFCWNEKWNYKDQCTKKSSHWETRIGQNFCKEKVFIEKKDLLQW